MGLLKASAVLLVAIGSAAAAPTPESQEVAATTKYCDAASTVCYSEFTSTNNIAFRIAIPDTATASAPFDVLLQIVAPKATGWAAIAWGGQMAYNPLTVAWPNGASVVVSSRRATWVFTSPCYCEQELTDPSQRAHPPRRLRGRELHGAADVGDQHDALEARRARPGRQHVDRRVGQGGGPQPGEHSGAARLGQLEQGRHDAGQQHEYLCRA